jgi:hypothetical protein
MDTAPDCSGTNVKPIVHRNWDGSPIILPDDNEQIITSENFVNIIDHYFMAIKKMIEGYSNLDELISSDDHAIISREGNHNLFVQWLLIFKKGHPILKEVIDQCVYNINNKTSSDLIELTGPGPYTRAINKILAPHYSKKGANLYSEKDDDLNRELNRDNAEYKSRFYGTDMDGFAKFENTSSNDLYIGNTYWRDEKQLFNK